MNPRGHAVVNNQLAQLVILTHSLSAGGVVCISIALIAVKCRILNDLSGQLKRRSRRSRGDEDEMLHTTRVMSV